VGEEETSPSIDAGAPASGGGWLPAERSPNLRAEQRDQSGPEYLAHGSHPWKTNTAEAFNRSGRCDSYTQISLCHAGMVSLPHHRDLRVGVHCLPHTKVQGDLEPCLTGTRRVLPIHFDHAAVNRPRVETRAPEMCAQGFGELGFLERDQQSVRSVLAVRRRGVPSPAASGSAS
jgi:hypothetical protein